MAVKITIPDIGTTVDHVTLVNWLKNEGDPVKRGDGICEVETDKAVSELESIAEGILLKQVVPAGSEIEQGTIVAYVGRAGEPVPLPDMDQPVTRQESRSVAPPAGTARPKASLVIRNLAKNQGVDLVGMVGTGPGGQITREDVLRAREDSSMAGEKLSANQSIVARRVLQSHRDIPPISLSCPIEMTALLQLRRRLQGEGRKASFDAFFVHAVSMAMKEFSLFRCRIDKGRIVESDGVHVGIALDVGEELFVPVIRNADALSIGEIEAAIQRLAEKAGKGSFTTADLAGATVTISNLGMYPVHSFQAIIPPDQAAILSIGSTRDTPVARNGKVMVIPIAMVTLSVDHRLINGRKAGEFAARVKEIIETL